MAYLIRGGKMKLRHKQTSFSLTRRLYGPH